MITDVTIRRVTESDLARVDEIVTEAFRSPASRMADLERYLALEPEVWLLALAQGKPVGTVMGIDYGAYAYVGNMTVDPRAQRQGIGSRLMNELLIQLDARGTPAVALDASEAGAPLYRRLGFVDIDRVCIFEQVRSVALVPMPPSVRRLRTREVSSLAEWDASVFGANRARVLNRLLTEVPDRAFVVEDEAGHCSGYVFAQPGRLGPWVVQRPQDAETLLETALGLSFTGPPRVIVPQMNTGAIDLLERHGFRLVNAAHWHMRRGGTGPVSQREKIYGQVSFGLG